MSNPRVALCLFALAAPLASHTPTTAQGNPGGQSVPPTPAFPRPEEAPRGIVLDEDSRPVAGARVTLVADTDTHRPFGRAIAELLQKTPLPEMKSQRDGTFLLPLTSEQRQLGAGGEGRFWLVVRKDGYLDWREPLFRGLSGYLGSRVILRTRRKDDPFATLPWPPASERMLFPWIAAPPKPRALDANRRGIDRARPREAKLTDTRRRRITVQLSGENGRPLKQASLLFGNSTYRAGNADLPTRLGSDGSLAVDLAFGRHEVRIAAAGFMPKTVKFAVGADTKVTQTFSLQSADRVDVLAVDSKGRPVPFTRMNIVAKDPAGSGRRPFVMRSDSTGRIRFPLADRSTYFAYSHFGAPSKRVDLDAPDARRNPVIRVPQVRPVTVLIEGDELPRSGTIFWRGADGEVFQRFETGAKTSGRVVTRIFARDHIEAWVGGGSTPPVVIRAADLPPEPREPLLDLAILQRKLRKRAEIVLTSTTGKVVRGFAIRPRWQTDGRWTEDEKVQFNRRKGKRWEIFARDNKGWSLWARDDGKYELWATARGHEPAPVSVPARKKDGKVPTITVKLTPK